jgi:ribosome-binding protein aMBF1 (putative translation factor)
MKSFFDSIQNESKANKKIFARETLIQNVTEDIMIAMEDLKISKSDLAKKIGKSKSYITQILSGSRNMTLTSLSDLCFELDITPNVKILEDNQKVETFDTEEKTIESISFTWHKEVLVHKSSMKLKKSPTKVISIDTHIDYTNNIAA